MFPQSFRMRRSLFILTLVLLTVSVTIAQNTVRGRVLDAQTKEALPFANVFFASTTIGSSTKEDGAFYFEGFPDGKYDLTVRIIGYQSYHLSVDFTELDKFNQEILLNEISVNLNEVIVHEDTTDWQINYKSFKKYFIGNTKNSQKCTIVNPESLHLYLDPQTLVLVAHSKESLIIENRALGYRISYFIDVFEIHTRENKLYSFGIPLYELMKPKNSKEQKKWEANREEAYAGSVMHFIRSLGKNQLLQNGFDVKKLFEIRNRTKTEPEQIDSIVEPPLSGQELFESGSNNKIKCKGKLSVTYKNEREEIGYRHKRKKQKSKIDFLEEGLTIYPNGYYENIKNLFIEGYWAWSEKITDMLPYDYLNPSTKVKKNTY